MKHATQRQVAKQACLWVCLVICLVVILGGCQQKEIPLSKAAQACKNNMLAEMKMLTTAVTGPVAQQDWQAIETILQAFCEKLEKEGKLVPFKIVVLDQNGITRVMVPPRKDGSMDFSSYAPARVVYEQKKMTQAMLYFEGKKIFVLLGPLLQQDQIIGGVALVFPEEELQKCHLSDKEFMSIDFNQ
jgi:hypothetical protein